LPYLIASAMVIHYEEALYIKCMHLYLYHSLVVFDCPQHRWQPSDPQRG